MDERIQRFISEEERDPRPLIISGCQHGVTESWGFKEYLREHVRLSTKFNIIARGAQTIGKPKVESSSGRVVGVELKIEEIAKTVLMLIHHTKLGSYRQRFGNTAITDMQKEGYLYVREDCRFWNMDKRQCAGKFQTLLENAFNRKKFGDKYPELLQIFLQGDGRFQVLGNKHGSWKKKKKSS